MHLLSRCCARLLILGALVAPAACDTSVTNPGLVPDEALDKPEAWPAIALGARRALSDALGSSSLTGGQLIYWGAAVSFEMNPAGSTGSFGIPPDVQSGLLLEGTTNADWLSSNQARYVAEAAVKRFQRAMPDTLFPKSPLVAQAYLYAGFANRLLGENFCQSVIPVDAPDGSFQPGNLGPHTLYFQRAEAAFSNALNVATTAGGLVSIERAALMGRASVRADLATYGLASWADAVADASGIPDTATFSVPYFSQTTDQYNYVAWARSGTPYRAHTEWGTFYENYYRTTKDPRVKWDTTASNGDAAVAKFGGLVPFWPEAKYVAPASSVRLSSGWEMRLIEAEAALAGGDFGSAAAKINLHRAALTPVQPTVSFATLDEGWTGLKTERALELWLEARRLGDIRRWMDNSVPGAYIDGTYRANRTDVLHTTPVETMTSPQQRSLCFAVGRNERETNPNIP
jgi:starch-binding outer membrane protein, SusD/RagB family